MLTLAQELMQQTIGNVLVLTRTIVLAGLVLGLGSAAAAPLVFDLREFMPTGGVARTGQPVPAEFMRVFLYEGAPNMVRRQSPRHARRVA